MPTVSMQMDNPARDRWTLFRPERAILYLFDHPHIQAVSMTWMPPERISELAAWVDQHPKNHAIFISMMDPCAEPFPDHPRVHYIGCQEFVYFAHVVQQNFCEYADQDLVPDTRFSNRFLCYQRKPSEPRAQLYNFLIDQPGVITLSGECLPEFNQNVPDYNGLSETVLDQSDGQLMPHDIWSLGDPALWRSSFLNIVSETMQHRNGLDRVFVSEKTFKPILGMRPFLHYGEADFSGLLNSRGFETFDEDFGYNPDVSYAAQAQQLRDIVADITEPEKLYQKLLPKIEHNRNHFADMVHQEWQRLRNLADHYHNLAT